MSAAHTTRECVDTSDRNACRGEGLRTVRSSFDAMMVHVSRSVIKSIGRNEKRGRGNETREERRIVRIGGIKGQKK